MGGLGRRLEGRRSMKSWTSMDWLHPSTKATVPVRETSQSSLGSANCFPFAPSGGGANGSCCG